MTKNLISRSFLIFLIFISILLTGCAISGQGDDTDRTSPGTNVGTDPTTIASPGDTTTVPVPSTEAPTEAPTETQWVIDYEAVKPNEAGKIMVVMFHNFIEKYKEGGDKLYSMETESFRQLLQTLYDKDYSLISLSDYVNNTIDIPAGRIPIIFTFDDGRASQFSLEEAGGVLKLNPNTAVGIMEQFYKEHPDFGLEGSFFISMQLEVFKGAGTVKERLAYLTEMGFEIGNHTLGHTKLSEVTGQEKILYEIGGNVEKLREIMPEYVVDTFSLPFGKYPTEFKELVYEGVYSSVSYKNKAILNVGWDPVPSPINIKFNPLSLNRVTAPGIEPVDCDLTWWLNRLSRGEQYVSDGNPDIFSVPESKRDSVDTTRIDSSRVVFY